MSFVSNSYLVNDENGVFVCSYVSYDDIIIDDDVEGIIQQGIAEYFGYCD